MKNEFVPYDIALAMKELGFDEPCIASFYNADDSGNEESSSIPWMKLEFYMEKKPKSNKHWESIGEEVISAPLYQQAFRWFRDNHDLQGSYIMFSCGKYDSTITSYKETQCLWSNGPIYETYEEAELACLRKLIEIINQNKDDEA